MRRPVDEESALLRPCEAARRFGLTSGELRWLGEQDPSLFIKTLGGDRRYFPERLADNLANRVLTLGEDELIRKLSGNREMLEWWIRRGKAERVPGYHRRIRIRYSVLNRGLQAMKEAARRNWTHG
jgi:hypothetical protein